MTHPSCRTICSRIATLLVVLLSAGLLFASGCAPTAPSAPNITDYFVTHTGTPPAVRSIDAQVQNILALHEAYDGSTWSMRWGNLSGAPLYVTSQFPDLGLVIPGRVIEADVLEGFIRKNGDLLSHPRCAVGTWYNRADGQTYVDISVVFADLEYALAEARKYNQITVWDLKNSREIPAGGTGIAPDILPSPVSRLPQH